MTKSYLFECELGGRSLSIETGALAMQASAAVTVRYGDTVVLVTACISKEPREGVDFLPLTVDYEERLYAAGKIPGGFIRREGRPSQEATLAARLTDRPLRPLLPKWWRKDIQLIVTVLSADQENDPDILAVIGGSAVLSLSEVPFAGPVSAVHIGYIDNQLVLNPTLAQLESSQLDMVVASTREQIVMVEAGAREVSEDIVTRAMQFGHEANQGVLKIQEELQQNCGNPKMSTPPHEIDPGLPAEMASIMGERLDQAIFQPDKPGREQALSDLEKELVDRLSESFPKEDILSVFDKEVKGRIRANIIDKGRRVSGRSISEVRPLECKVGLLPRTHGSGLFVRGRTQVLTITTLGSIKKEQQLDGLGIEETKRFIHHYNFPPFSTGESKRIGTPGRREIGHGALAERALVPVIPQDKDFPYTIRLVSEVLSSSGSTSMGSVCASSLSLMDAGIPIKRAVAGVAMGLITDGKGNYAILTDIEGIEDNYGDMDFKVAGTTEGITALQMDTKLEGLSLEIIEKTIHQAKEARLLILDTMHKTIESSRSEVSRYAPRMYKIMIAPDKIGSVIGTGGKTIRSIIEETKTTVDIENDGTVLIGSPNEEAAHKAIAIIENLTKEVGIGEIYTGKITRLMTFGAFVEILPGKEGMVHISELADHRVANIEDEVKVGDEITVKVIKNEEGKIGLSRKAVFEQRAQAPGASTEDRRPESHRPQYTGRREPRRYDERPPRRSGEGSSNYPFKPRS